MASQPGFKLTQRAALLALIAAAYPMTGMAAAAPTPVARVDFAVGGVTATGTDGKTRKLVRGEMGEDLVDRICGRSQAPALGLALIKTPPLGCSDIEFQQAARA